MNLHCKDLISAEDLVHLAPSERTIIEMLGNGTEWGASEIADKSGLSIRTVRWGVIRLTKKGYVRKRLLIRDMRRVVYSLKPRVHVVQ
jgi:predicted transcriptional regulator